MRVLRPLNRFLPLESTYASEHLRRLLLLLANEAAKAEHPDKGTRRPSDTAFWIGMPPMLHPKPLDIDLKLWYNNPVRPGLAHVLRYIIAEEELEHSPTSEHGREIGSADKTPTLLSQGSPPQSGDQGNSARPKVALSRRIHYMIMQSQGPVELNYTRILP